MENTLRFNQRIIDNSRKKQGFVVKEAGSSMIRGSDSVRENHLCIFIYYQLYCESVVTVAVHIRIVEERFKKTNEL